MAHIGRRLLNMLSYMLRVHSETALRMFMTIIMMMVMMMMIIIIAIVVG